MTHAHTTLPIYLRADTINGIQYCDHDEVVPEHEYLSWYFADCLSGLQDDKVIFTQINTQIELDYIIELYGIN